ncbi:type I restriction-modification system [Haemophilus influenzae]|uniref:Type I restriction-modification system n=1 Tax=Haemophilus influenzae TaxID=727 RepID=A0A2X1Q2F4_HAEIF|nr:type I restriction-modification system [Haemophilus influenzae]
MNLPHCKALQAVDLNDPIAMEKFKQVHYVNDEQIAEMLKVPTLPVRAGARLSFNL